MVTMCGVFQFPLVKMIEIGPELEFSEILPSAARFTVTGPVGARLSNTANRSPFAASRRSSGAIVSFATSMVGSAATIGKISTSAASSSITST